VTNVIQGEAREFELAIDLNSLIARNHLKIARESVGWKSKSILRHTHLMIARRLSSN
jgi:hypothetical protein